MYLVYVRVCRLHLLLGLSCFGVSRDSAGPRLALSRRVLQLGHWGAPASAGYGYLPR